MRILVGAFGTRGDVQPLLALAQAARRRGHDVTLALPPEADSLARAMGFEPHLLGLNFEAVSKRIASGSLRDVLSVLPQMRAQVGLHFDALEPLASRVDLIVGASVFITGSAFSERFKVPFVYVPLAPGMLDSPESAGPLAPWVGLPRWLNRLGWWVTHALWNVATRGPLNRGRARLGLPPAPDVWRQVLGTRPMLATDPVLGPAPHGHPAPILQPGALLLDDDRPLSESLERFLSSGPPPVYLGFGSMSDLSPAKTTARLITAAQRAGVRAIISRGWAGLGADEAPRDVFFAGPEPHATLFPRCAAIVHHGGAGTTHAAALAGVPQLVLPQVMDQFYWRSRTRELGVSPAPVSRFSNDPEPLAKALVALTTDSTLRQNATALAARMTRDGTARALELLEQVVNAR